MDEPNAPLEEKKLKQKKPSTKDAYNDVRYKKKYKELKRKIHDMEEVSGADFWIAFAAFYGM